MSAVMNLRVLLNAGNFLTSCKPVSFSRRTLHRGVIKYVSTITLLLKVNKTPCSHRTNTINTNNNSMSSQRKNIQKILIFVCPIHNNWRYIGTIYIHNKTSLKRNVLAIKQNTNNHISIIAHLTIHNTNRNQQQRNFNKKRNYNHNNYNYLE